MYFTSRFSFFFALFGTTEEGHLTYGADDLFNITL